MTNPDPSSLCRLDGGHDRAMPSTSTTPRRANAAAGEESTPAIGAGKSAGSSPDDSSSRLSMLARTELNKYPAPGETWPRARNTNDRSTWRDISPCGPLTTNEETITATTSRNTTLRAAPPTESMSPGGRLFSWRSKLASPDVSSMPVTAAANAMRIATNSRVTPAGRSARDNSGAIRAPAAAPHTKPVRLSTPAARPCR